MATTADAEVVLKLYDLRREESLRLARRFMTFEFNPKTHEELYAVSRDPKSDKNVFWRQALSYWEMAASLVNTGAIDPELFLASNAEGILLYAKFHHFHAESEKETNNPFMRQTAALIDKYDSARRRYEFFLERFGPAPVTA
ncbi:hypothetical protein GCM10011507_15090 [Edaphobacter acidisoli]|uniref:Uncharacterized protein n=1 Tax=Edaphobacter acidisoli TaxID=2040573 RepID=A0A916RPR6_9BACT|nr:hypothetical protein [Edaphobacter acidisoli]GGA64462.1 hypothetical protein GCM10011507_15090 [Edaphobacter acidisoli]